MKQQKALTLKTLTKSNVWELQENDILHMWESAERDADLKDNMRHYIDVIKIAFDSEVVETSTPEGTKSEQFAWTKTINQNGL